MDNLHKKLIEREQGNYYRQKKGSVKEFHASPRTRSYPDYYTKASRTELGTFYTDSESPTRLSDTSYLALSRAGVYHRRKLEN